MAKTLLEPVQTYISKERKARLLRIVAATEHRMTMSKLMDEALANMLPALEEKYGRVFDVPTHEAPRSSRRHRRSSAA